MQEVVGRNAHLPPGMVGFEAVAAGLVPPKRVLALLDPILHLATAIVYLDDLLGCQLRITDNKTYTGKKFARVPFDLADHPALTAPALDLVVKSYDPHLNPCSWGTANRAGYAPSG